MEKVNKYGLTKTEQKVIDKICEAWAAFNKLEPQHPDEAQEFLDSIHRLQDMLTIRIARRCFPYGWPTYKAVEAGEKVKWVKRVP